MLWALVLHIVPLSARGGIGVSLGESLSSIVSDSVQLSQVVVTGTRTPKTLANTPVLTRIITAQDIERSDATDIQDLLRQEVPGVEFSYAMNQQTHLNFAGFGGQSILFLVDGERLAGETLDDVDFSRLVMADVERIEIVKGASSALYGSSAGGGVINIITKEGGNPWTLHLDSRWSRHKGQRYALQFGRNTKRISNLFTSTFSNVESYRVNNDPNPTTRVFSEVYGSKVVTVKDRLSVNITDRLKLTGRLGYYFRQVPRVVTEPERYRDLSAGLKAVWQATDRDLFDFSYSFDEYNKSTKQQATNLDLRTYSNVQNHLRALYTHTMGDGSQIVAGADFMRDYLYNTHLDNPRRHQYNSDAFVQYDWIISPRWELVGALRYDYISDGNQSRLTPKFSMRYNILMPEQDDASLTLRFGYGMGFRAPTLKEKYSSFDMAGIWVIQGNPNLKTELSNNFNVALSYARSRYSLMLMGYCNTMHNKITTGMPYNGEINGNVNGNQTSNQEFSFKGDLEGLNLILPYINLDRFTVYGMEFMACAKWGLFSTTLGYTLTKEKYTAKGESQQGAAAYLPTRPHAITWTGQWEKEFSDRYSLSFALNGRFLSAVDASEYVDYYDISKGMVTVNYPAYTLWKLSMVNRLYKKVRLTLALDNLFNYRPSHYYLNAPATDGTNFMVGLSVDF